LRGYYEGKRAAETELLTRFAYGGIILRPGFIYGTRSVGSMKIPLGVFGSPMEMVRDPLFIAISLKITSLLIMFVALCRFFNKQNL
jgi:hypothetical protein